MNRRDFLQFRSTGGQQIMLLSCQRLYIGYTDARSQPGSAASDLSHEDKSSGEQEWWNGEPPLAVEAPPVEQLFAELREEIIGADVLVLEDREWMQDGAFSRHVQQLLQQFRTHGGEVRYATRDSKADQNEIQR